MDQSAGFRIAEHTLGVGRKQNESLHRSVVNWKQDLKQESTYIKHSYHIFTQHKKIQHFYFTKKFKSAKKKLAFAYYTTLKAVEEIEIMKQK